MIAVANFHLLPCDISCEYAVFSELIKKNYLTEPKFFIFLREMLMHK